MSALAVDHLAALLPEIPNSGNLPAFTRGISAAALMEKRFEPIRWIVPGYLPEGLTVLAGAPKLGKSWLALAWMVSVASGGLTMGTIPCEQGSVLGLMLEDNERRLQRRLMQMRLNHLPRDLTLLTDWPTLDDGCCDEIEAWIAAVERPRLVVVDVFARVRGNRGGRETDYDGDYRQAAMLQSIASRHNLAIVAIHRGSHRPARLLIGTRGDGFALPHQLPHGAYRQASFGLASALHPLPTFRADLNAGTSSARGIFVKNSGVIAIILSRRVMAPRCQGATVARLGKCYFVRTTVIAAPAIGDVPVEAISRARWVASAICGRA